MPEIFLLSLVYSLLTKDRSANVAIIWTAFLGGLAWDLRWVGFTGFYTISYTAVVLLVIWAWSALPVSGRTTSVIFFLFWAAQLVPSVLFFLTLERDVDMTFFVMQQSCAAPLSLLGTFLCYRRINRND
ncbi:hypothetical protein FACS1894204_05330 [Synergistales bacterium]|nr:hypothetical protein FACS1894204_05330 [Synergistales bacterium]